MKSSDVLKEMQELKIAWRKQLFVFTRDQQERYNILLKLRRERVNEMTLDKVSTERARGRNKVL